MVKDDINYKNLAIVFTLIFLVFLNISAKSKVKGIIEFKGGKDSIIYANNLDSNLSFIIYDNYIKSENLDSGIYQGLFDRNNTSGIVINDSIRVEFGNSEKFYVNDSNIIYTIIDSSYYSNIIINMYSIERTKFIKTGFKKFKDISTIFYDAKSKMFIATDEDENYGTKLVFFNQKLDSIGAFFPEKNGYADLRLSSNEFEFCGIYRNIGDSSSNSGFLIDKRTFTLLHNFKGLRSGELSIFNCATESGFLFYSTKRNLIYLDNNSNLIWSIPNLYLKYDIYKLATSEVVSYKNKYFLFVTEENKLIKIDKYTGNIEYVSDLKFIKNNEKIMKIRFDKASNTIYLITSLLKEDKFSGIRIIVKYEINANNLSVDKEEYYDRYYGYDNLLDIYIKGYKIYIYEN